jgi:hypothetical protein
MDDYYKDQLKRLKNGEYQKSLKLFDGNGNATNQMDLNIDSIPVLIQFLQKELKLAKKAKVA